MSICGVGKRGRKCERWESPFWRWGSENGSGVPVVQKKYKTCEFTCLFFGSCVEDVVGLYASGGARKDR